MLSGNRSAAPGESPRLDNRLHAYLVERAENRYVSDFFARHGANYEMLLDFAAPEARVVEAMAEQHREILTALLAEDWPLAGQALSRHIRRSNRLSKGC